MHPLTHAFRLHDKTFKVARGQYLDAQFARAWLAVADAYEVAADAHYESGDDDRGTAANRWATAVALAVARGRAPRPRRCPPWWVTRKGLIRGRGVGEVYTLLQDRVDPYTDGWYVFDTDTRGLELERDDNAGFLPSDNQAVLVGSAALAVFTGCDLVRWR